MSDTRWTVPPDTGLAWRRWDDEAVVFHPPSGSTHRLDTVSAAGLACLQAGALTTTELAAQLAATLGVELDDDARTYAERLVHDLAARGIVEEASV